MSNVNPTLNRRAKIAHWLVEHVFIAVLIIVVLGIVCFRYSTAHYADSGGPYILGAYVFHGIPCMAAWVLTLFGFLFITTSRFIAALLFGLGIVVNITVIRFIDHHTIAMYLPIVLLAILQLGLYVIWKYIPRKQHM